MRSITTLALMLVLALGASVAQGQTGSISQREEELKLIEREIGRLENQLATVSEQKSSTITLLERIKNEKRLHQAEYNKLTLLIEGNQHRISQLTQEIDAIEERLEEKGEAVTDLFIKLYKRGSRNYLKLLLSMESMETISLAQAYLSQLARTEVEIINDFNTEVKKLKAAQAELDSEQQELVRRRNTSAEKLKQTREKELEQQKYLQQIQRQTGIYTQALADRRRAREELQHLIRQLAERQSTVTSAADFAQLKGALIWPVEGQIVTPFGTVRDSIYNVSLESDGIEIEAQIGDPVLTVADGTVIFSGWQDMGGNMVVIDHGNRYYTIYAHLSRILVEANSEIRAGDMIGEVGDSASLKGAMLRFEIRHITDASEPRALNPVTWLRNIN